jgi:putative tricarboxylic transport membrane protein
MPRVSLKKVDIISALLLLPVCAWVFYESGKWPRLPDLGNPGWIPRGVAVCLLIAAALLLARAFTGRSLTLPGRLEGADRTRVLWVGALTGGYVILVARLGFIAATIPYLFGFGLALGERRWVRLAVFAVVVPVAMYLLFDRTLNVPLPQGWFR